MVSHVFVARSWDAGQGILHHYPVVAHASLSAKTVKGQTDRVKRRQAIVNPELLNDPTCVDMFKREMSAVCAPSWSLSANDRLAFVTHEVQKAAMKAFGKTVDRPRSPFVTEEAWECMLYRNDVRSQRKYAVCRFKRACCRVVFSVWSVVTFSTEYSTDQIGEMVDQLEMQVHHISCTLSYHSLLFVKLSNIVLF